MNRSKAELKKLVPEDAKEASGHEIKAKRSESGAIGFELSEARVLQCPISTSVDDEGAAGDWCAPDAFIYRPDHPEAAIER